MSTRQEQYLQEYEAHKHIEVLEGLHHFKSGAHIKVMVSEIDLEKETASLTNLKTGTIRTRTLHWCRKNLVRET